MLYLKTSLWVIGLVILFYVLYIGWVYLASWLEVKNAPREEMFNCDTHGPIRKVHLITFMDVPYCPICFHEKQDKQGSMF